MATASGAARTRLASDAPMDRRRATGVALVLVVGGRVRLRVAVRPAGLRGRRRLADAVGLALPVRGRLDLVLPAAVGRPARGLRGLDRRAVVAALGLGVLYVGNSGTYYAALETVSPSLAALIVYLYPAIVAVLSLRFGHRLQRTTGVDRPGDLAVRRRPRRRRHRSGREPARVAACSSRSPRASSTRSGSSWPRGCPGERREAVGGRRRAAAARRRRRSP